MKLSDIRNLTREMTPEMRHGDIAQRNAMLRALGYEPGALYQELEMESRFVETHQDISWSNFSVNLHSHTFYEVLCCRNSCGAEYLVESERYRLQKGDIVFIPPGISHRPLLPDHMTEPYIRDVLWFSTEFVDLLRGIYSDRFQGERRRGYLLRTAGTKWEFLCDLFRTGVQEAENSAFGWQTAVLGNSMLLLTHMARAFDARERVSMHAEHGLYRGESVGENHSGGCGQVSLCQ